MKKFPHVSDELLKALEEAFPDTIPRGELTLHQYASAGGQQSVLDFLRHKHSKQKAFEG